MNTRSISGVPRLIVSRTLLALLAPEVPNLDESLAELERNGGLRRFPDSSTLLEGMARLKFDELLNHKPSGSLYNLRHLGHHVFFRTLAPFPQMSLYELLFPKAYNESLGREWFKVEMTAVDDAVPSEWKLEDLAITVLFRRRPNEKLKERYASAVNEWLESVCKQGIFDEGPVLIIDRPDSIPRFARSA
jgi:hypothetical protein